MKEIRGLLKMTKQDITSKEEKRLKKKEKYICPDCGEKHNEEHHPPYCWGCISAITL